MALDTVGFEMMMGMALGLGREEGREGGQKKRSRHVVVVPGVQAPPYHILLVVIP